MRDKTTIEFDRYYRALELHNRPVILITDAYWDGKHIVITIVTQRKPYIDCIRQDIDVNFNSDQPMVMHMNVDNWRDHMQLRHYIKIEVKDIMKFMKLLRKRMKGHDCVKMFKLLKQCKAQSKIKEWDTVLPDRIVMWASRRLQAIKNEMQESCVDNYRVARVGNTCQERRYRRNKKQGCCGFLDIIEMCPHDGLPYRLGFNYGH